MLSEIERTLTKQISEMFKNMGHDVIDTYISNQYTPDKISKAINCIDTNITRLDNILEDAQEETVKQTRSTISDYVNIQKGETSIATKKAPQIKFNDFSIESLKELLQRAFQKNNKIIQKPWKKVLEILRTKNINTRRRLTERLRSTLREILINGERKGLNVRDIGTLLQEQFKKLEDYEAERIARTEVISSHNLAKHEEIMNDDLIDYEMWIATDDERTRESHLEQNGMIVRKGDMFPNGCMYPGDENGDASETINCRCTLVPFIPDPGTIAPPGEEYWFEEDMIKI